jgi:hypothetical protein
VGFLFLDLAALPNRDLLRMERTVAGGVGGDTVSGGLEEAAANESER